MEHEAYRQLTAAYALDALDEAEAGAYEEHLAGCELCREELAALSATAVSLAYAAPAAEPPPSLRDRILDAAGAERPNVVPLGPRRDRRFAAVAVVAAAAACVALVLGAWNVVLQNRLGETEEALSSLPLEGAPGAVVVRGDGDAVLVAAGLDAPPSGKTYEAWVVRDGAAVPAGLFAADGGVAVVRLEQPVERGALVAVTLEPAGGSAQPTTDPIFASAPL
jgi:anti-sigma-K factor RskA